MGYINDFGQVTGSYTESNNDTVAFAGSPGRLTTISDPLAPAFSTLTAAINDAGVVAGEYFAPARWSTGSLSCTGCSLRSRIRPAPKERI